jgi:hypothetical protein
VLQKAKLLVAGGKGEVGAGRQATALLVERPGVETFLRDFRQ